MGPPCLKMAGPGRSLRGARTGGLPGGKTGPGLAGHKLGQKRGPRGKVSRTSAAETYTLRKRRLQAPLHRRHIPRATSMTSGSSMAMTSSSSRPRSRGCPRRRCPKEGPGSPPTRRHQHAAALRVRRAAGARWCLRTLPRSAAQPTAVARTGACMRRPARNGRWSASGCEACRGCRARRWACRRCSWLGSWPRPQRGTARCTGGR